MRPTNPRRNVFQIDTSTGEINFSEEVGKTFLWKSIIKNKDKDPNASDQKSSGQKGGNSEKSSRGSAIKKRFETIPLRVNFVSHRSISLSLSRRIRKLSLNFLGPDEDQPLVSINPGNDPSTFNPQLPAIVIERPENSNSTDRRWDASTRQFECEQSE